MSHKVKNSLDREQRSSEPDPTSDSWDTWNAPSEWIDDTEPAPTTTASILALIGFVVVAQVAGLIGVPFTDRATDGWYGTLELPWFTPPSSVFGPVWTALYLLIGVAAWQVWRFGSEPGRSSALTWWAIQLILNAAWAPLFFGARALWVAFIEILVMLAAIAATVSAFRRVEPGAAWLLAPYLLWVSFVAVLNGTIASMN